MTSSQNLCCAIKFLTQRFKKLWSVSMVSADALQLGKDGFYRRILSKQYSNPADSSAEPPESIQKFFTLIIHNYYQCVELFSRTRHCRLARKSCRKITSLNYCNLALAQYLHFTIYSTYRSTHDSSLKPQCFQIRWSMSQQVS